MKMHRYPRTGFIKKIIKEPEEKILTQLRDSGLVSRSYNLVNLQVDLWCLRKTCYSRRIYPNRVAENLDPLLRIYFYVILQAVNDLKLGRPCDVNLWELDQPPTDFICTHHNHICSKEAMNFLMQIPEFHEVELNLSPGSIKSMVIKMEQI